MKTPQLIIALLFLTSISVFAQAPHSINYQAVARKASGALMADTLVNVEFIIHDSTTSGTVLFDESYTGVSTNHYGTFTVAIGDNNGTISAGSFSTIAWDLGPKFLEVKIYGTSISTTELISAPYALYAERAGIFASSQSNATISIGSGAATTYDSVTIKVPSAGRIVVDANVWTHLIHANGTEDQFIFNIGNTTTDLGDDYNNSVFSYPSELPSITNVQSVTFRVRRVYTVTTGGTYTFYVNGRSSTGGGAGNSFWYDSVTAEFH